VCQVIYYPCYCNYDKNGCQAKYFHFFLDKVGGIGYTVYKCKHLKSLTDDGQGSYDNGGKNQEFTKSNKDVQ